ncbi:ubiquitin-activating enzyme [Angomonas deanei]|nr:ubiquitin-activating enzyme [Angomonas deanei]|eukprot:EPY35021.1 ubiquitin-activating enzyme [Angomonas deanei]
MLNAALYERTQILLGNEGIRALQRTNVFLAGVGGVGGHCAEALVRAGVGRITIMDHDVVSSTNKNRQLIALDSTTGKSKVEELAKRLRDINSNCCIIAQDGLIMPGEVKELLQRQKYDFVVDCIDSVECKIALLLGAAELNIRVFSSCGAGGKMDPSLVQLGDLYDTENDGLARACRQALRQHNIKRGVVTVVHSKEKGLPPLAPQRQDAGGRDRSINGTISYMPPLFGLFLSSAVLRCAVDTDKWDKEKAKELKKRQKDEEKLEKKKKRAREEKK